MNNETKESKGKPADPELDYQEFQRKQKIALRRAFYKKDKEAMLKARQNARDFESLSNLEPPDLPSVLFYPPPVTDSRDDSGQASEIFERGDAYIDVGEVVDSLPPLPPPPPRKKYEEFSGAFFEAHDSLYNHQIWCSQYEGRKAVRMRVKVDHFHPGTEPNPVVIGGFANTLTVTDYLWDQVTLNSRLNSLLLSIELDTQDYGHSESYATVSVRHVVELSLNGRVRKTVSKEIFSHELSSPERVFYEHDLRVGTEITTSLRVFSAKTDLTVREYIEVEADSDAWVYVEGNFYFDSLKAWWVGVSFAENIGMNDLDKIKAILMEKPVKR